MFLPGGLIPLPVRAERFDRGKNPFADTGCMSCVNFFLQVFAVDLPGSVMRDVVACMDLKRYDESLKKLTETHTKFKSHITQVVGLLKFACIQKKAPFCVLYSYRDDTSAVFLHLQK